MSHFVTTIFDIVAVLAVYWVSLRYQNVNIALENTNDVISFNNRLFFYLGLLIMPIIHVMGIIEATAQSFYSKYIKKFANHIVIFFVIFFLTFPIIMLNILEAKLDSASYRYCQIASNNRKISSDLVYVKDMQLCTEDLKNYKPVF